MHIEVCENAADLGSRASSLGATFIREAREMRGEANIIVATGTSQFETLNALVAAEGIDWSCVTGFHLDEYIGMAMTHPASFRAYLKKRFVDRVPLRNFYYIHAEKDAAAECERLNAVISPRPVDVAFIGIGENGHLAFNDPPADFDTEQPFIVVELDEHCRRQQAGEGWFESLADVPRQAISMSISQIMKTKHLICSVPDARKADAVAKALNGPVTPQVPASILQHHPSVHVILDESSARQIKH